MGFEPTNNGFAIRLSDDTTVAGKGTSENSQNDFVKTLAILAQKQPELAQVIEAWDNLPTASKTAIMALVKAAQGT